MDFWASLEHQLRYKSTGDSKIAESLTGELKDCSETIADIDQKMQDMFKKINLL